MQFGRVRGEGAPSLSKQGKIKWWWALERAVWVAVATRLAIHVATGTARLFAPVTRNGCLEPK